MKFKLVLICVLCFTFFSGHSQTDDGRKDNTSVIKVKENIYMLQGKGGNIGFSIGEDGVFMIDDQFAEGTKEILKDIRRLNDGPIKFLVNTHAHGDHTGGNANMAKEGAIIVAHAGVYNAMKEKLKSSEKDSPGEKVDETAFPVITFEDKMNFHYNDENILVFHVDNAHTDGDAIVYFTDSNVMHTGDVLFNGKYPYIDLDSGGSVQGYIDALDKLFMLCDNDTKIIPGHGNLATMADLKASRNMLFDLHRKVTYHFLKGKTEAQIVAMRDFTAIYDVKGYGNGYISTEKILRTIFKEVSKEQADFDPRSMEARLKELEAKYAPKQVRPKSTYRKTPPLTEAEKQAKLKDKIRRDKPESDKKEEEGDGGGL